MKHRFSELGRWQALMATCSCLAVMLTLSGDPLEKQGTPPKPVQTSPSALEWMEFHSVAGQCAMRFPSQPEHISEMMKLPDESAELRYDAYIASLSQDSVFMLLVAQYPSFVDNSYAQMGLETFLNGILNHNPANQLLFADLVLVDGHQALDFFIRTGSVFFKGRAMMVGNSLYLMAMECEMQSYDEKHYNNFIESFRLLSK